MTAWMHRRLEALQKRHLLRTLRPVESGAEAWLEVDGRRCLNLSSNNYLGLAGNPVVRSAAAAAAQEYGAGAGAARLIAGTSPLHEALELKLASFKGTEGALLYSSGYTANLGVIPSLVDEGDTVFGDELNHASIIDGVRLSGAAYVAYPHRDMDALEAMLKALTEKDHKGRRMVVTDTVFSMDGDLAPLPDLVAVCERYDAVLMVDDAHGTGCIGPAGKGAAAYFSVEDHVPVTMGTLSKALGGFGAFIAGDSLLRDYLMNTSRSFMFTTALPPAVIAASMAALEVLERESELPARLQENAGYLRDGLRRLGFDTLGSETQIIPVKVGDSQKTMEFAQRLREEGVFAVAIRPPTVPPNGSRIRASVMATHTRADLDLALNAFQKAGRALGLLA